jgi:hypothetical protein
MKNYQPLTEESSVKALVADIVVYLTAPENQDLGIVKSLRPKRAKPPLELSPFPF